MSALLRCSRLEIRFLRRLDLGPVTGKRSLENLISNNRFGLPSNANAFLQADGTFMGGTLGDLVATMGRRIRALFALFDGLHGCLGPVAEVSSAHLLCGFH